MNHQEKSETERLLEQVRKNMVHETDEVLEYFKEPKHIRTLKIIVIILAVLVFGFLIYQNFIVSQEFNYFYDIGSEEDIKSPYLSPKDRVSDASNNSRELTGGLVYFDVPIFHGSEKIKIQIRFMDNLPNNSDMLIGAKDQETWHYFYGEILNLEANSLNHNDWTTVETRFNMSALYIKKGKLSLVLRNSHLSEGSETKNHTIPIDWIKITVYKPGLLERNNIKSWSDIPNLWRNEDG